MKHRFWFLNIGLAFVLLSCSERPPVATPTPTATLPTPTPQDLPVSLAGNQKGFFLVNQAQVIPLIGSPTLVSG